MVLNKNKIGIKLSLKKKMQYFPKHIKKTLNLKDEWP